MFTGKFHWGSSRELNRGARCANGARRNLHENHRRKGASVWAGLRGSLFFVYLLYRPIRLGSISLRAADDPPLLRCTTV